MNIKYAPNCKATLNSFPDFGALKVLEFPPPEGTNIHHGDSNVQFFLNLPVLSNRLQNYPLGMFMTI
jgi:hypothetical protein